MDTIIGLDLGKDNTTACALTCRDGEVRFAKLPTTTARLRTYLERERPDRVVFEACAQAGFAADLCRSLGLMYAGACSV